MNKQSEIISAPRSDQQCLVNEMKANFQRNEIYVNITYIIKKQSLVRSTKILLKRI